jgi:hypothetical protein
MGTISDSNGNAVVGATYSMLNSAGGMFTFDQTGNILTATSSTPDGIYFVEMGTTATPAQWVPIIVGDGLVAPS